MTQLGPNGVEATDPAFPTAFPQPLSCLGDRARGKTMENAARPNPANQQPPPSPSPPATRPSDELLSESANGIITHHLNKLPDSAPGAEHRPSFRLISVLELTSLEAIS